MSFIKELFETSLKYIKTFLKWLVLSVAVGIIGGIVGTVFHLLVDYAANLRINHSFMIYFLPVSGLIIVALYNAFKSKGSMDTNLVIHSIRKNDNIPFVMVPLIFVATIITHLFGGSAGREGAALQIGGGLGYNLGKLFKFNERNTRMITRAGMSSVFSALFGTPVTAAVFSLEVSHVGALNFTGFFPCIISSVTSYYISSSAKIEHMGFGNILADDLSFGGVFKVIALSVLCALLSVVFCSSIKKSEHYMKKYIKNSYFRAFIGGTAVLVLTLLVGNFDYNGAGVEVIESAISGNAKAYDFILKIVFTAITIAAGFKGGEIIPSLFIGSTFGCVAAPLLGLSPSLGAAIGMVALFCGAVNCPIASVLLSVELFGADGILFFGVASAVSYIMSGYSGLYKSQKIEYSKLTSAHCDTHGE